MTSLPYPLLTARYAALAKKASDERLAEAKGLLSGDRLADEFNEAAKAFGSFMTEQPFFPGNPERDEDKDPESNARTYGWAMEMKAQDEIPVEGGPGLNFRYVEREIVPTRTKPALPFADAEGTPVRVDLILANASSKRPIVGELKIGTDKDPFTGLVQALAGAAQFCSPSQRERLCRLPRGSLLATATSEPLVDVYVLLAVFPSVGRHRLEQLQAALEIAENLESRSLCDGIGRIRVLALGNAGGAVLATAKVPNPG
jgi:hypothetical protein